MFEVCSSIREVNIKCIQLKDLAYSFAAFEPGNTTTIFTSTCMCAGKEKGDSPIGSDMYLV